MPTLDEICPRYVGEDRLVLALAPGNSSPRAFGPVTITVDYSRARPVGISLPLVLTITAPSSSNYMRRFIRRTLPSSISFSPREGGRHLVRLAETAHNRWWGALVVVVTGERTDPFA